MLRIYLCTCLFISFLGRKYSSEVCMEIESMDVHKKAQSQSFLLGLKIHIKGHFASLVSKFGKKQPTFKSRKFKLSWTKTVTINHPDRGTHSKYYTASEMKFSGDNFFSDCNGIRTHNHLVCKRTFSHLANLAKRKRGMIRRHTQDFFCKLEQMGSFLRICSHRHFLCYDI